MSSSVGRRSATATLRSRVSCGGRRGRWPGSGEPWSKTRVPVSVTARTVFISSSASRSFLLAPGRRIRPGGDADSISICVGDPKCASSLSDAADRADVRAAGPAGTAHLEGWRPRDLGALAEGRRTRGGAVQPWRGACRDGGLMVHAIVSAPVRGRHELAGHSGSRH